jgi:hypothetical protein
MKLFSPHQLQRETRPLSEKALDALEARDIDTLNLLLGRMSVGHQELYLGYIQWVLQMFGRIRHDLGEGLLDEVIKKSASFLMAPYAEAFQKGDEKGVFSEIVSLWRDQLGKVVPLSETAEEIAFSLIPCGSGGRVILEGWSETMPRLYPCWSDGSPIFCRACRALQQAFNDRCGTTVWSMEPDSRLAGACRMSLLKQRTKGHRLFDIQEIGDLTTPRCQRAIDAISRGDFSVQHLIRDQHLEWRPLHDFVCLWVTALLTAMYQERGTEYVDVLIRETYGKMFDSAYMMYSAMDTVSLFKNMVRMWYYHQASFRIEEEEDRFVFLLDPCGSGGRLYRGDMGKPGYRYGTGMLCLMREPADVNFHRSDFPIYCTHCAVTNRDQFEGKPWAFVVDGSVMKEPLSPCVQYLYKKEARRDIDPAIPAQVGISKVSPLQEDYVL